ncbi:MAG: SDR family NAD(P)-dependent oxidoreductase, partial [Chloroflexi bacterium]|nr:SDR family NAD(P)-dependent oxidoreductase [Chloroflexota bacterium]
MGLLDGRRAVVTGSSRGIGRAYAKALAAAGAKVVVNGTTKELVLQVVDEIRAAGGTAVPCVESISTFEGAERLIKSCADHYGGIDILVNNAGVVAERMMFYMTEQEFKGPMMV